MRESTNGKNKWQNTPIKILKGLSIQPTGHCMNNTKTDCNSKRWLWKNFLAIKKRDISHKNVCCQCQFKESCNNAEKDEN